MREYRPAGANGDVALLVDFWNLVHGVEKDIDREALYRFAGEHGRVAAANAYPHWSEEAVNGYQQALRGLDGVGVSRDTEAPARLRRSCPGPWSDGNPPPSRPRVLMRISGMTHRPEGGSARDRHRMGRDPTGGSVRRDAASRGPYGSNRRRRIERAPATQAAPLRGSPRSATPETHCDSTPPDPHAVPTQERVQVGQQAVGLRGCRSLSGQGSGLSPPGTLHPLPGRPACLDPPWTAVEADARFSSRRWRPAVRSRTPWPRA